MEVAKWSNLMFRVWGYGYKEREKWGTFIYLNDKNNEW